MSARVNALWRELQKSASPKLALQQKRQNRETVVKKADAWNERVQKEETVVNANEEDLVLCEANLERMMRHLSEKKPDVQKRGLECLKARIQRSLLADQTGG